ncbi:MAG: S8 family serine peptidase [Candidatus Bathyarchaeia archaeon]
MWSLHVKKICSLVLALSFIAFAVSSAFIGFLPFCSIRLLLRFRPGVPDAVRDAVLASLGLHVVDYIPQIDIFVVSVSERLLFPTRIALLENPLIDFVEVDSAIVLSQVPNDLYYSSQWHLINIDAPGAWDISTGSSSVIIAVLDSGVDASHPDLAGKLLSGWNFYDNNADTSDVYGHGTKVAGVAAAIANNGIGVAGVAWICPILPVRVTDTSGYITYSLLSKGLVYAADRGAKVAVISFQIFSGSSLSSAAKYFVDKGGVVVAAAGNTGKYESYSDNPYIISVGATTISNSIVSFSSYGPYVDLVAPGVSIYTTIRGGGYGAVSGTSFSAPIVAGIAALIFSVNPSLSPVDVERILESTAVDLGEPGYDVYYGWGRVNAYAALKAALERLENGESSNSGVKDAVPPSVKITYPVNGATVSGAIIVSVDASDDSGVSKVELYKDGVLFAVDSDAPYEFYWDTTNESNGVHVLVAKAYDAAGNIGESGAVNVNVANNDVISNIVGTDNTPPTVSIVKPKNKQIVSKVTDIIVSASDESGISKVEFYVDGGLIAVVSAEPYTYGWDTKTVKNGWHTITVKAYDSFGNSAETGIKVYVYNK